MFRNSLDIELLIKCIMLILISSIVIQAHFTLRSCLPIRIIVTHRPVAMVRISPIPCLLVY
jgi:hypothetical protein